MTLTPKVLFKIALLIAGCVLVYFFWKIAIAVMAIFVIAALTPNRTPAQKRDDWEQFIETHEIY